MTAKPSFKAEKSRQISVFVENRPGTLAAVATLLGEQKINIYAMTLTGGIDHGYVQLVVDKTAEASALLDQEGYLSFERDVVLLEIANEPGSLAEVIRQWGEAKVNIDYAYCAGGPSVERGLVVVRVDDADRALEVLN